MIINAGECEGNAEMTDGLKRACVSFDRIYLEWSICVFRFFFYPFNQPLSTPRFSFFVSPRVSSPIYNFHTFNSPVKRNRLPKAEYYMYNLCMASRIQGKWLWTNIRQSVECLIANLNNESSYVHVTEAQIHMHTHLIKTIRAGNSENKIRIMCQSAIINCPSRPFDWVLGSASFSPFWSHYFSSSPFSVFFLPFFCFCAGFFFHCVLFSFQTVIHTYMCIYIYL